MSLEEMIYAALLDSAKHTNKAIPEPTATELTLQHVPADPKKKKRKRNNHHQLFLGPDEVPSSSNHKPHAEMEPDFVTNKRGKKTSTSQQSLDNQEMERHQRQEQFRAFLDYSSSDGSSHSRSNDVRANKKKKKTRKRQRVEPHPYTGLGLPMLKLDGLFDPTMITTEQDTEFVYPVDPRRRTGANHFTDPNNVNNFDDEDATSAAAAAAEANVQKKKQRQQRYLKRQSIVRRWHWRRVDFRMAEDVGGAFSKKIFILKQLGLLNDNDTMKDPASMNNDPNPQLLRDGMVVEDNHNRKDSRKDEKVKDEGNNDDNRSDDSSSSSSNAEPEDMDVMEELMKGGRNKSNMEEGEEESFWELGYTAPRRSAATWLPKIDLSAQASAVSDDHDSSFVDPNILSLRRDPCKYLLSRDNLPSSMCFPLFHSRDPAFSVSRAYLANPSHVLRVLAIRYAGNNAAISKQEQKCAVSLLWKLHTTNTRLLTIQQKPWDFRRLQLYEAARLGEHMKALIENRPKVVAGVSMIDLETSLLYKSNLDKNCSPAAGRIDHGTYVFLPGTCPPIPSRPLDWIEMTWGGMDRHNNVVHYTKYYDYTYMLSNSILVADRNPVKQKRFFRHCKRLVEFEMKRMNRCYSRVVEIPNPSLADVIRHVLAVWDDDDDDDDMESCLEWLKRLCDSKQLRMMRDLQLTCALMDIASKFIDQEAVTDILSRDPVLCNPIAMFQEIMEDHQPADSAAMEYIIHRHTKRTSVERNATDPMEYAWYMSFLATSLVVCDGNSSFLATRIALAQALQLLYKLHTLSPSELSLSTLKALGNWEKVWRLLLTGSSDSKGQLRPVLPDGNVGKAFDVAARAFESQPSSIESWRRVAQVLGPVSIDQTDSWNLQDRDWWYIVFLKPMNKVALDAPFWQHESLTFIDEGQLMEELPIHSTKQQRNIQNPEHDTKWLDDLMQHLLEYKTEVDDLVAKSIDEGESLLFSDSVDDLIPLPILESRNMELECLTYKVLLLAHFRTIDNVDVGSTLLLLLAKAWEENDICQDGVKSLQWLQRMGIDTNTVYKQATLRHKGTSDISTGTRRLRRRTIRASKRRKLTKV